MAAAKIHSDTLQKSKKRNVEPKTVTHTIYIKKSKKSFAKIYRKKM